MSVDYGTRANFLIEWFNSQDHTQISTAMAELSPMQAAAVILLANRHLHNTQRLAFEAMIFDLARQGAPG